MEEVYTADKDFDKIDFTAGILHKGEYEGCVFTGCNFSGATLAGCSFVSCTFDGCNLSMAKLAGTALREVQFKNCKMLGLRFDECNDFGLSVSFDRCILDHSSFYQAKLKKTVFKDTQLHEADFTEADLSASVWNGCDLAGAVFDRTLLEKADFRTAYNYSIDPEHNRIKKAKFSLPAVTGLLHKYNIDIEG